MRRCSALRTSCLYFANSLIVTLVSMWLVLLFGAMAAWALTEYKFKGSTALAIFLSIGIMVPIRLGSVAILQMMRAADLNDTLIALILVYIAQGLPLSIFILERVRAADPQGLARRGALRRRARRRASSSR